MDDDVKRGLSLLVKFAPLFSEWILRAVETYHDEHSPERRVRLTRWTRENYIYDETACSAEVAVTPIPIRVFTWGRMRWLTIDDGDLCVDVWFKKVDPQTLLTNIYPTMTAKRRQRTGQLTGALFGEVRRVLFVCGHVIYENIAGSDSWIDRLVLTQERRDREGHRFVTLRRTIYDQRFGEIPLRVLGDDEYDLFTLPPVTLPAAVVQPAAAPISPPAKVRPRRPGETTRPASPKVGMFDEQQRIAEARKDASKPRRSDGSQGA